MPKGVEHAPIARARQLLRRLFSTLMPKGVEHLTRLEDDSIESDLFSTLMPKGVEHSDLEPRYNEPTPACFLL